jgi:site-specific DNA-methyltransferase (cytosine-N4-specific)
MRKLPEPLYTTRYGRSYVGDSLKLLKVLPDSSIDLILTSPPFALQCKKEYGNKDQDDYADWLLSFAPDIHRVLKETGSFVLDLGGAYRKGRPVRSLYNYRVLIRFCDEHDFKLAEEFFWHNPSKLPSPIEWVNKRKIRAKDAVNTVWWFSKTDYPKADIKKVLTPYSDRMKKLIENPDKYYKPKARPSGHNISSGFGKANSGAIPSNLLSIPNTESNSQYLRLCKQIGVNGHPARFPEKLPSFFIKFLTDPEDLVLDVFAGSNTTGHAAEELSRNWLSFDLNQDYIAASVFRFLEPSSFPQASEIFEVLSKHPPSAFMVQGSATNKKRKGIRICNPLKRNRFV